MKKFLAILLAALLTCSLFVACNFGGTEEESSDTEVTYDLEGAAEYVKGLYKDDLNITSVDYSVVSQVMVAGVTYQIEWSVDSDKVTVGEPTDGKVVIGVDEKSPEAVEYKLTATIKADNGETTSVTFKLNVPKYEVNSHADFMAAQKGDIVTVEGIVVAINSKKLGNKYNRVILADASGNAGYYCHNVKVDPSELGIKVGMTVKVTGTKDIYNSMPQLTGGEVAILDSTTKEVATVDVTEKFTAGADLSAYVGLPVVIKGVKIGSQALEKETDQYLYFKSGEKTGYLRTYITDFPTSLEITLDDSGNVTGSPAKDAIDADHAAHFGYKADVTGILVLFSGTPYLVPMSTTPFTNYEEVVVTPAEKVAAELGELKVDASFSSDTVLDLVTTPKYYSDVTITWALDSSTDAATLADGKLTIVVPDEAVTVTLTATATCGDATDTKTFTIKLSKAITPIADAIATGAAKEHDTYTEEKYIVAGIIKEVYNPTYGNMYIIDELGNTLTVYGTYIGGQKYGEFEGAKPQAGDYVVLVGVLGQYKGTPQMKNADITSFTTPTTIPGVIDAVKDFEKNQYTEDKAILTGVITEIQNATYGNVVIQDAEGNSILVYGLYSATGTVRYDAMETKPAVGDTITVLGIVGKYNDAQMKNGWLIAHTPATTEEGEGSEGTDSTESTEGGSTVEPVEGEISIKDAIALGSSMEHDTYTADKYYVTGVITEVYNTTYGNMKIKDSEGNILTVYGTYSADGSTRYDKMDVKPVAGDTVTVYGIIGQYNSTPQVKNAWITAHTPGTTTPVDPEPSEPVNGTKYTFANYEAGVQYAANEVHKLDDNVTVTTTDAHFTTQLRLYKNAAGESNGNAYEARDGYAVFAMSSAVKGFSINAGDKAKPIAVYGSTDGATWTLITTINATSTYTDYTIELGDTAYTYIKLAAVSAQVRIASVTIELQ